MTKTSVVEEGLGWRVTVQHADWEEHLLLIHISNKKTTTAQVDPVNWKSNHDKRTNDPVDNSIRGRTVFYLPVAPVSISLITHTHLYTGTVRVSHSLPFLPPSLLFGMNGHLFPHPVRKFYDFRS